METRLRPQLWGPRTAAHALRGSSPSDKWCCERCWDGSRLRQPPFAQPFAVLKKRSEVCEDHCNLAPGGRPEERLLDCRPEVSWLADMPEAGRPSHGMRRFPPRILL